jgi:hypothetical protein
VVGAMTTMPRRRRGDIPCVFIANAFFNFQALAALSSGIVSACHATERSNGS